MKVLVCMDSHSTPSIMHSRDNREATWDVEETAYEASLWNNFGENCQSLQKNEIGTSSEPATLYCQTMSDIDFRDIAVKQ